MDLWYGREDIIEQYRRGNLHLLIYTKAALAGTDLNYQSRVAGEPVGTVALYITEPELNQATEDQIVGRVVRYSDATDSWKHVVRVRRLIAALPPPETNGRKMSCAMWPCPKRLFTTRLGTCTTG